MRRKGFHPAISEPGLREAGKSLLGGYGVLTPDQTRDTSARKKALAEDCPRAVILPRGELPIATPLRSPSYAAAYLDEAGRGLVLTRRGRAKKNNESSTPDTSHVERHVISLIGHRTVKDLTTADLLAFLRDVISGKSARRRSTTGLRGHAVLKEGKGTATRTMRASSVRS